MHTFLTSLTSVRLRSLITFVALAGNSALGYAESIVSPRVLAFYCGLAFSILFRRSPVVA